MADPADPAVLIRYFAAARAATGTEQEWVSPVPATLDDLLTIAVGRHGAALQRVLPRCSYLLDEIAVHDTGVALVAGAAVDVLPPFAGG
ncbi:MoaD/ThiS family protein [Nakamurella sp. YIM 132087]|uniref:MoaD/ThiS family protein n=1 Tax=Nakamurella alba TaxID=2665158 RepID=A0A7K1FS93_9ACTN|nr:MoaD/ThiS family protein [Nakamurella alba]MTD17008.1 MoaD/ThiS family protein [Nakamurella alba]